MQSRAGARSHCAMNKRSSWYDPSTENLRPLAALEQVWRLCNNSEEVMPCARTRQGYAALQTIKEAINDYAELEMGHRECFWGRPPSAGCKHT
jgi:hypothetical protein